MSLKYDEDFIKINLNFFDDEKTEKPTPKKRNDARSKGQVANSQELNTAFLFLTSFYSLKIFGSFMFTTLLSVFTYSNLFIENPDDIFTVSFMSMYLPYLFMQVLIIAAPLMFFCMLTGVLINVYQVGWHPTTKPLKWNFKKLNPISGFKKFFSIKIFVDLIKAMLKFSVIAFVIFKVSKDQIFFIPVLMSMTMQQALLSIFNTVVQIGLTVGFLFLFIGIGDLIYARYKQTKDLKMSKHDIKEENKQSEGDPLIKQKIRQKMFEISMRRMMQDVPSADVIITNPTHYAVALKYDRNRPQAPIVIAKGVDFMAKRIKEAGFEHEVEIVENKKLARALYASVEVGQEIPEELYQSVAEILAFVYKLKNKL